ncbi:MULTISPECIES: hypothetical protein, partial [unclassified Variovorax]|uniref:hypothetical protein n=1 Tax=unclassified Variovorax TaxID=663243 RepID=UPI001C43358C
SGSSCTPSQRAWTTDPAHQPSTKTEGTEKTLTSATLLLPQQWLVCCIDRLNPPSVADTHLEFKGLIDPTAAAFGN